MRWLVERSRDKFEDVGAEFVGIHESGALVFTDEPMGKPVLIIAPGQWLTVCEAAA